MYENKDTEKEQQAKEKKPLTKLGDIKSKIEVSDIRERSLIINHRFPSSFFAS